VSVQCTIHSQYDTKSVNPSEIDFESSRRHDILRPFTVLPIMQRVATKVSRKKKLDAFVITEPRSGRKQSLFVSSVITFHKALSVILALRESMYRVSPFRCDARSLNHWSGDWDSQWEDISDPCRPTQTQIVGICGLGLTHSSHDDFTFVTGSLFTGLGWKLKSSTAWFAKVTARQAREFPPRTMLCVHRRLYGTCLRLLIPEGSFQNLKSRSQDMATMNFDCLWHACRQTRWGCHREKQSRIRLISSDQFSGRVSNLNGVSVHN
jgi:hypothetical protein